MKVLILISLAFFFPLLLVAQSPNSGIIFGTKAGLSSFTTEINNEFEKQPHEFEHGWSPAFDIEISKLFGKHFEIGMQPGYSLLKGNVQDPQFSAEGWHASMPEPINDPVEYHNQLYGVKFFGSYYFRRFERYQNKWRLEPFVRGGAGWIEYVSKLYYQDDPDNLIFGKNTEQYDEVNLATFVIYGAAGIKTYLSDNLFINISYALNYTNYDFLDVVHNYTPTGEDANLKGLYSEIKIGIFYHSNGGGKSKGGPKNTRPVLPFAK